jgi:hypothetical protein
MNRRATALTALAQAIAADNGDQAADREWAWAVQHVNETILHRNAFSGADGITAEQAEAGLADYLTDHKRWSDRIYEAELAAGLRFCTRETSRGLLPAGTIVHDIGNADYVARHLRTGYADKVWPLAQCPARHEHRRS